MTVNVWAQVGAVTGFLPMSALTGAAGQLLGMDATASFAEWKAATFLANQLATPVGTAAAPSHTFTGDLNTGMYQDGADIIGFSAGGTRRLQLSALTALFAVPVQLSTKLLEEDFSADIVAGATTDLATATGNVVNITNAAGATNIASLGGATIPAGTCIETKVVITGGSVTFVYDANQINLPSAANLVAQTGDKMRWRKTNDAAAWWELYSFQRGLSSSGITNLGDLIAGTLSGGTIVPGIHPVSGGDGQILATQAASPTNDGLIWIPADGMPELLTNPDNLLDQINEGALYTVTGGGANVPLMDGVIGEAAVAPGVFKVRRIPNPDRPNEFCMEVTCTTIDAAIGATDNYGIFMPIEGYDTADLAIGTASAKSITLRIPIKFSKTGAYGIAVRNSATNRTYVTSVTQNVANTWETKTVTIPMDTAGVWLYTSGVGLYLSFCLSAGANFQTAAGAWSAGNFRTIATQATFMDNIANIGFIGRVRLIPGTVALPLRAQDYARDLRKNQRQYYKTWAQGTAVGTVTQVGALRNSSGADTIFNLWLGFPVTMRAVPAGLIYSPATGTVGRCRNDGAGADVVDLWNAAFIGMTSAVNAQPAFAVANQPGSAHGAFNSRLT